jgi:glycosyltransferase involved in cell wall biosynthesis
MKIWLVVDYEPVPGIDGDCRYLRYGTLATVLALRGHDITWWTSDFDHAHKRHRHTGAELDIQENLKLRLLPGDGYKKNISLQRLRHNRSVAKSFVAATHSMPDDARPDVIVACLHTLELSEAAAAYARSRAIPFVVDIVDIWPEVYLRAFPTMFKKVMRHCLHWEYLRARRVIESAREVTAVSHAYLKWALSQIHDETKQGTVFPLGYDESASTGEAVDRESDRFVRSYDLNPGCVNVAFVGQLSHSYDLDAVVAAARLLFPLYGDRLRFFIAGDGVDRTRLEASAQDLPTVAFTGWLSHPAIIALLRNCSVGLVSYAGTATQSLPYKPFEYMAAGLALVSCLQGELAELISGKDIGLQYTAGSPESLALRIREIMDYPEHRSGMQRRARELFDACYRAETIYGCFSNQIESVATGVVNCSPLPA